MESRARSPAQDNTFHSFASQPSRRLGNILPRQTLTLQLILTAQIRDHHARLSRYQRTVLRKPLSKSSVGSQPRSALILRASMAYRRSCPGRSSTKVISEAYDSNPSLGFNSSISDKADGRARYWIVRCCHRCYRFGQECPARSRVPARGNGLRHATNL